MGLGITSLLEKREVAFILSKRWTANIVNTIHVNDRLMMIKLKTQGENF